MTDAAYDVGRYSSDGEGLWCCVTVTTVGGETRTATADYLWNSHTPMVGCGLEGVLKDLRLPWLDDDGYCAAAEVIERQLMREPHAAVTIPSGELRIELVEPPRPDIVDAIDELLSDEDDPFPWHDAASWSAPLPTPSGAGHGAHFKD